ncbi:MULTISPECIES: DNA/RNA non-specific endonuclease [unclassified Streptomyces]|uniref:DNA/RNA non-specific endonuclease n=1 Tax=unclassified Streptomyces TaxID=2593676 RepID=UPI00380082A7
MGVVVAGALTAGILSAFPALADDGAPAAGAPVALGGVAATGDDQLFALAADHSAVYRWNGEGTGWTKVGGPAETLLAGGAGLFATAPDTGKVFKYEGTPDAWSPIGEPGADFAVTGDHLYALNPDRTAVYEWAGTGTDWTKVGGPAEDLDAGGAGLFATGPDGKIFKYEGTPETWTQIGEPGAGFAVTGDRLYGIAADRTAVYEWAGHGTDWSRVGGPAQDLYAGGAGLFATDPATGQLSKYDGKPDAWTKAGDPGAGFTVSDTHLYGLAANHTTVLRWDNAGTGWTPLGAPMTAPAPPPVQETTPVAPAPQESVPAPKEEETESAEDPAEPEAAAPDPDDDGQRDITPAPVQPAGPSDTLDEHAVRMAVTAEDDLYTLTADKSGLWKRGSDGWSPLSGAANAVYAGRAGVFMTADGDEQVRKYNPATSAWDPIGGAAGQFAVTGKHLYRLVPDGIGEWNGATWTAIGGPARNIYAGRAGLFATNPDTGDLYKYDGKPDNWTRIGGPGAQFAIGHDRVYSINPDHTAVYEWAGKGTDWTRIGGPAKNIYAGGAGLYATNPDTGNIHQYNNAPDAWTEVGGPGATFAVSDTQLYGLSPDLTAAYRWNGTGSDWTRLGGAADIAQQAQDEKLLAANCETGRDCVQEYRDAKELLETSLTDWLTDNGGQILIDTFGVTATLECVEDHDLSSCLEVAADAGTTLLGIGAVKKSYKIGRAVKRVATKLPKFREKTKQASDTYDLLRKTIDEARKLNDAQSERGQDKTKPQDDSERLQYGNCLKDGKGWRRYGKRDATHGNRATGAYACLNEAFVKRNPGSEVTADTRPPGYKWATRYARYLKLKPRNVINNCHLLGADLGGEGDKLENLATCSRQANFNTSENNGRLPANMYTFEEQVSKAINKDKQTVEYTVEPQYEGPRTVPVSFKMKARGVKKDGSEGLSFEETIPNSVYSLVLKEWRSLGTVTYPDVPIPVGSTQ